MKKKLQKEKEQSLKNLILKTYKKILLSLCLIKLIFNLRGRFSYNVIFYADGIVDEPWMRLLVKSLENSKLKFLAIIIDNFDAEVSENYYKKNVVFFQHKRLLKFFKCYAILTPTSCIDRKVFNASVKKIVYLPHSLASLHMVYPENFSEPFNAIFAAGPHHVVEFKNIKTHKKQDYDIYEIGYPKMKIVKNMPEGNYYRKKVLFAPSWGQYNLEDIFSIDFFRKLQSTEYLLVFRPHPLFKKKYEKYLITLKKEFPSLIDECPESLFSLHESSVLISDFSGISMEYMALTKKPVIFLDLPRKIINPDYGIYGIEPMEIKVREMKPNVCLKNIDPHIIKKSIISILEKNLFHRDSNIRQFIYPSHVSLSRASQTIKSWF